MIKLQPFNENDFNALIEEIPDARFLLQWAGPKYRFPLDKAQLQGTLSETLGQQPKITMFKAVLSHTMETVGHIQLMSIDYNIKACSMGRVLIYSKYRGKGFGKEMVTMAVQHAFEILGINEIMLGVFDFNKTARAVYKNVGFVAFEFDNAAVAFENEKWNRIRMKIQKQNWKPL